MNTLASHAAAGGTAPNLVGALVRKDWSFVWLPMIAYLVVGLVAVLLLTVENRISLIVGVSLLVSIIVIIGVHFIFGTVLTERSKQTLPFIMSLPITYRQYSAAKLISCVGGFAIGWAILLGATLLAIASDNHLPGGLAPYAVMVLLELFAAFAVTLAVAMVAESEVWTIVTMTILNVSISIFMNIVGGLAEVGPYTQGPEPVWNATVFGIIGAETLVIVAAIGAALALQARKTDFL
jgi:hypothetical protein